MVPITIGLGLMTSFNAVRWTLHHRLINRKNHSTKHNASTAFLASAPAGHCSPLASTWTASARYGLIRPASALSR